MEEAKRVAPIGVFDSGIGGVTVLRALRQALPQENFIYLGDTARIPYGPRGTETVIQYSLECANFLRAAGAKLIVAACNTSSSLAGDVLRDRLDVPFVGTIEASVELACQRKPSRLVAILGTEGTVRSGRYQSLLRQQLGSECRIEAVACPLFVPVAEEGIAQGSLAQEVMKYHLANLRSQEPELVILACTHYPFLKQAIGEFLGPQTFVLDCSDAIAEEVLRTLEKRDLLNGAQELSQLSCLVTDAAPRVERLVRLFLNQESMAVQQVRI